jgi:hypothetical protein
MTEHCDRYCGKKFRSPLKELPYQGFNLKRQVHAHVAGHVPFYQWGFDVG